MILFDPERSLNKEKRGRYKNSPSESVPYVKYGLWYKLSSVNHWSTVTSNSLTLNHSLY